MNLLDTINSTEDLKKIKEHELPELCREIRKFLLDTISQTGGHLASNLGSVELTVALHYVYNSPKDVFCWDVGHQTYVHKILTGRKNKLHTVRTFGGLSGFPKRTESEHDHYETGHAGTSISQAVAEAVSRDILDDKSEPKRNIIAIIGDASIASGMALEALNHAGHIRNPFLVVLNDNEMSISPNVGALSYSLSHIITTNLYQRGRRRFFRMLHWIPFIGPGIVRLLLRFGANIKSLLLDNQFFEELGFRYLGPVDGHDVLKLISMFRHLEGLKDPSILHIVTRKGKGYSPAEFDPVKYHGVRPFETGTGEMKKSGDLALLSDIAGNYLSSLALKDKKLTVITPAMKEGSGLVKFAMENPENFFDVGIAEQHGVAFAGGLAKAGLKPFLFIYSTFLQRGFDQLLHDIALMNLPVRIIIDRAGCVGGDGETHQGLFDISFMYPLPNLRILSPRNSDELKKMIFFLTDYGDHPVAIRFPKADLPVESDFSMDKNFNPFSAEIIRKGKDILILCEGFTVQKGEMIADKLKQAGLEAQIISVRSIKPLDKKLITNALKNKMGIFTIENHGLLGGMASIIKTELYQELRALPFQAFGYPDIPIEHGSVDIIEKKYRMDADSIFADIISKLGSGITASKIKREISA